MDETIIPEMKQGLEKTKALATYETQEQENGRR
jgi:hypothetical protein